MYLYIQYSKNTPFNLLTLESIKKYSYANLTKMLSGKSVHFTSDCDLFPNFNVIGKVLNTYVKGTELVFKFKTTTGKVIDVGSNMKNLKFELT